MPLRKSLRATVKARVWPAVAAALTLSAPLSLATAPADAYRFAWSAPPSYAQTVLTDSPSAYFRLDDAGTVLADSSGHGHAGSVPAGTAHTAAGALAGDADGALQVDQ